MRLKNKFKTAFKNYGHILVALQAAWMLACSPAPLKMPENSMQKPVQNTVQKTAKQSITVYVTVDWEGATLENDNLEAMQDFRKKYPKIAMLQLITPSYFVRPNANKAAITAQIKSTFLPIDKVGLHIHGWQSLVNFCGVKYQNSPSFADQNETCETGDCGYSVSLENAYSQSDLTKLVACSSEILAQNGFAKPTHFRAGGWQFGPKLSAALQTNNFTWDSSVIDANLLTISWHPQSGMVKMLQKLHPNATPLDQAFVINENLIEYPNNAALADYTSTKQLISMFNALIKNNKSVMVLGFHQETAANYIGRLDAAIAKMETIAKEKNVNLIWASY
jgi:hypothetical protein